MKLCPAIALSLTLAVSAALGGEPENHRRPTSDAELERWLANMVWRHRFTADEIQAATGLSPRESTAAIERFGITPANRPRRKPSESLLVLPYPGGPSSADRFSRRRRSPTAGYQDQRLHAVG